MGSWVVYGLGSGIPVGITTEEGMGSWVVYGLGSGVPVGSSTEDVGGISGT
jgi:hypothetical protein